MSLEGLVVLLAASWGSLSALPAVPGWRVVLDAVCTHEPALDVHLLGLWVPRAESVFHATLRMASSVLCPAFPKGCSSPAVPESRYPLMWLFFSASLPAGYPPCFMSQHRPR